MSMKIPRKSKLQRKLTLTKASLEGQERNRTISSMENQMIHKVSMMKNGSVAEGTSSSTIRVKLLVMDKIL